MTDFTALLQQHQQQQQSVPVAPAVPVADVTAAPAPAAAADATALTQVLQQLIAPVTLPEAFGETASVLIPLPKAGDITKVAFLSHDLRIGWQYWDTEKKCHRSKVRFTSTPGIREGEKQREFIAGMVIYVWQDGSDIKSKVGPMEISKSSILQAYAAATRDLMSNEEGTVPAVTMIPVGDGLKKDYKASASRMKLALFPAIEEILEAYQTYNFDELFPWEVSVTRSISGTLPNIPF